MRHFSEYTLQQNESVENFGVWYSGYGLWDLHAREVLGKLRAALGYLRLLLACHRVSIKVRAMMIQTLSCICALYGSEVWNISQATTSFDMVAKDVIRSVMGLLHHEIASHILFTDIGLLPPSLLMDAAKQCYQKHLSSLQPARWCKQARMCHFYGHRLGQVQKVCGNFSHGLNISDIFVANYQQPVVRRVSCRPRCKLLRRRLCHR